jgi:phage terminase small subunit
MKTVLDSNDELVLRPLKTAKLRRQGYPRGLTSKQKLFVEYYLQNANPQKAALKAGYSPSVAEVAKIEILENPHVVAEIRRRADEKFKNAQIDTSWVLQEATKLAGSNMLDYVDIEEDGTFKVNLNRCTRDMGAAIQELSYDPEGRPKIKLVDKKGSVELLARIKKLFSDSSDQPGGNAPLTIQSLDQIVQNVTIVMQSQENQPSPKVLEGQVSP